MPDRLTDLVLGLQRLGENAKLRGDDLRYTQQQETYEHIEWLDRQLAMVEKVRIAFLEERKRFLPVDARPAQLQQQLQEPPEKRVAQIRKTFEGG